MIAVAADVAGGMFRWNTRRGTSPNSGTANTDAVLRLVAARARDLGIRTVLVPSTSGVTALEARGIAIHTVTHAFGGLSRAVRNKYNTHAIGDFIANTLRIFGEGTKVAVEITLMAADCGVARTDERLIAMGGSDHGLDTAIVCKPVNAQRFFDLRVEEILCKPRFQPGARGKIVLIP